MKKLFKRALLLTLILITLLSLCCCKFGNKNSGGGENEGDAGGEQTNVKLETAEAANKLFSFAKEALPKDTADSFGKLLSEIEGASFSVSDFSGGGGSMLPSDSLVFKDKTLYILGGAKEGSEVIPISYILRLYEAGGVFVSTENGETAVSTMLTSTDAADSLKGMLGVIEALAVTEKDLIETDVETKFELSASYVSKLEKAIKDSKLLSNSGDFYINGIALDTEKLKSDNEIALSLDRAFTDGELIIKIAKPEDKDGKSEVNVSVTVDKSEIKASVVTLADGGGSVKLEISAKNGSKMTLDASVKQNGDRKNEFSVDVSFNLTAAEQTASCTASFDVKTKLSGALSRISGDLDLKVGDELEASGNIVYDGELLGTVGAKPLTVNAKIKSQGEEEQSLVLTVEALRADTSKEYALTLELSGEDEPLIGKITSPATVEPSLSEVESKYLARADLFFGSYGENVKKMEALTAKVRENAKSRNPYYYSCGYYTVDESGLVFFTDVTVENNYISAITTQFVVNHEDYLYFYRENADGGFAPDAKSLSELDAIALRDELKAAVPGGFTVIDYEKYWAYKYLEERDMYIAIKGFSEKSAIFLYTEPVGVTIEGLPVHKLGYDEEGKATVHSFITEYTEDCRLKYCCEICGFTLRSDEITHNYSIKEEIYEGGALLWSLNYCERCNEGTLTVPDSSGCSFNLTVTFSKSTVLSAMKGHEDVIDSDPCGVENMFIISDIKHSSPESCEGHASFEIPEIYGHTKYKLIGITNKNNPVKYSCGGVDTLVLSDEIRFLGYDAFYGSSHKEIILPDSLIVIMPNAFSSCTELTKIEIPTKVTAICGSTFSYCRGLTEVTLPKTLTAIHSEAFKGCSSLKKITLPAGVTSISDGTFEGCTSLESISFAGNIGKKAFKGCTSLTTATVCGNIGEKAFYECTSLGELTIPSDLESSIGAKAFWGCTSLQKATLSGNVTVISSETFYECTALAELTLSEGIGTIEGKAFYGCTSLKSLTVPGSIKAIRDDVFCQCTSLTELTVSEGITHIYSAFERCYALSKVTLPSTLKAIDYGAFLNCTEIKNVYYNGSVEEWCNTVFDQTYGNPLFGGANLYCNGVLVTSVTLPDGITKVPSNVFSGCISITEVIIPEGVTEIGMYSFANCTSLKKVVLPESLEAISMGAFSGCNNLSEINFTDGISAIEARAFENCTSLRGKLSIKSLTWLGNSAFLNCTGLTEVILYEGIEYFYSCFAGCSSLEKIVIPKSTTLIAENSFSGCTSLKDVYYVGSAEEWQKITVVSTGNSIIDSAVIHYNYTYGE